jgi:hypothetical protein
MPDMKNLAKNTRVMVPVGDYLYRGIVAEPPADHTRIEGMICIELTPPVKTMKPYDSINYVTCPVDRVTLGWL